MENATDFDLQELESRLYSQVFHSTENWDIAPANENTNLNNVQTRHVSPYAISNVSVNGNRYWDEKNNLNNLTEITETYQNNDKTISEENTIHQRNQSKSINIVPNPFNDTVHKENSNRLESIIPLENIIVQEYRTKPLKYKSYFIPTTFQLPKAKVKRLPPDIIKYFGLNSRDRKRRFRAFLRYVEKRNNNNKNNSEQNESQDITVKQSLQKITITANGIDRDINLSDIPVPVHNKLIPLHIENIMTSDNNTEIITLSDSDSDSVIEVPLPPVPVYNVDTSSDSEEEELENHSTNNLKTKGNKVDDCITEDKDTVQETQHKIDKNGCEETASNHNDKNDVEIEIDDQEKLQNVDDPKIIKKNLDMNVSFTQLEKERDEFLFTPDSNTNDFLEHDVRNLSKNNLSFNFGLHSSDLDLTKDREETVSKAGPSTNEQDLYETESSCSEIGSVTSKTRPVFNEINFESPIKDIFCEPDLSKFSNFITPNRNMQTRSKQSSSKIRSNTLFTPIQTKACETKISEENTGLTRSDSSEYHSDPTILKVKKKNKKAKKRPKKKGKQSENTEGNSETEDAQITETNLHQGPTSSIPLEEVNNKALTPSKQIENLKFGPSTNAFTDVQINSDKTSIFNSTEGKQCSSPTHYYVDTYFADDCLMLEELEDGKKSENTENKTEASNNNEKSTKESLSVNIETTQLLPSDIHTTAKNNDNENVNFSFVDTWRKSTDKNCNKNETKITNKTENDASSTKKLKANHSPTVHPYVVTVISSDEESNASEKSIKSDNKINSRNVNIDDNCADLIVVNVKNDQMNSNNTSKRKIVANPFSFINTYLQNQEKKSFKDFWTNDMTKFYDESWGQENFDMDKTQSSMSGNNSDWKIIQDDLYTISRRKRGPLCLRCREFGHTQYNCSRFNGPIKCSTCGITGHSYTRCPNSICTTCRTPTNHYTTSCRSCAHFRTIQCSLCNNVGHEVKHCPDLWRRYHLTTESHSELKTSSSLLKTPGERWCANCAKKGHCDDKCTNLRHEHFPTTPGIISYVPTYDDVFKLPVTPPSPNIPMFKNANVTIADLRTMKKNVVQDSNKKYMNILKQLRQQCNKYDTQLIDQIDRLRRNMNNQEVTKKKIQEIYKIRARIEKYKIS